MLLDDAFWFALARLCCACRTFALTRLCCACLTFAWAAGALAEAPEAAIKATTAARTTAYARFFMTGSFFAVGLELNFMST